MIADESITYLALSAGTLDKSIQDQGRRVPETIYLDKVLHLGRDIPVGEGSLYFLL